MCQELTPEEQNKKEIDKSIKENFGLQSGANSLGCREKILLRFTLTDLPMSSLGSKDLGFRVED